MAFAIAPLGYRRYEPTPNGTNNDNSKFLKHESQIPITEHEAQRTDSPDLFQNLVNIITEGRYSQGIDTGNHIGDFNLNSDSGHALRYMTSVFAGTNAREKDMYWQQLNQRDGYRNGGGGGGNNSLYGQQNNWQPPMANNQNMYAYASPGAYHQPSPQQIMQMEGGIRPIDELMTRMRNLNSNGQNAQSTGHGVFPGMPMPQQRSPAFPGMGQPLPGMTKTASAQINPGMPGMFPTSPGLPMGMNNPAEDLRSKRQTIQEKFANSGIWGNKTEKNSTQTTISTEENLKITEL